MKTSQKILLGIVLTAISAIMVSLAIQSFLCKQPTPTDVRINQSKYENEKIANSVDTMSNSQLWRIIGADFDSAAKYRQPKHND